jgi:glyceraldehyde 3-phosphate dehydrogenase
VNQELINQIYRAAADGTQKGLLVYSEEQNVPADVTGMRAAVVIEAVETHTRTGFAEIDLSRIPNIDGLLDGLASPVVQVPVTHAKVFGWYDNEYGSYTNLMGDLSVHIHRSLD